MAVPVAQDIDLMAEIDGTTMVQLSDGWHIENDSQADWAIRQIAWHEAQIERRQAFVQAEIERLQQYLAAEVERHTKSIQFFTSHLRVYYEQLRQQGLLGDRKTYRLPHGALQVRATGPEFQRDDNTLLEWARQHGLVRVRETPDWSAIKKRLAVHGNMAVDSESGEFVPGVSVLSLGGEAFYVKTEVE